jgi:glycosyltransferase involved in cell wall biosynthesis
MKRDRDINRPVRCPTLDQLPSPPLGKVGWPWTEESPRLPGTMPDGALWPRISVVTPSFNQAQFVEATIRSVLLQGYPNLEYIVVDGGSTDGSVDIIRKYENWVAYWISEPDRGQSDALNKGLARATGNILGWINSDDLYCPGAVSHAVELFQRKPETEVVYGSCYIVDVRGRIVDECWAIPFDPRYPLYGSGSIRQQALFWRNTLMRRVGMVDQELVFCMDRDLILRLIWNGKVVRTTKYLGMFRHHAEAKTATIQDIHHQEKEIIQLRYRHYHTTVLPAWFWRVYLTVRRYMLTMSEAGWTYTLSKLRRRFKRRLRSVTFAGQEH